MREVAVVLLAALAVLTWGRAEEAGRRKVQLGKGMELYSWRDSASGSWRFALLPGTNRVKPLAMIVDPAHTISNVEELKKQLAVLAVGESVFWVSDDSGKVRFELPPKKMADEVVEAAKGLRLELVMLKP